MLNRSRHLAPVIFAALALGLGGLPLHAASWFPFGPDGGDARAFAADPRNPQHLYLGTTNGWIYESMNGGRKWARLARLGNRDDLVSDNIVVDPANPQHILVGTWVLGNPQDGGLFVSNDGGATWTGVAEMRGQSVLSLAEAPSDPKIMVMGTLEGIFRSTDSGATWRRISPKGDKELHEVESLAIDPVDPGIVYAGTWHLPWKTTDAGDDEPKWTNIKQGIIEDSDVFSIIVDPKRPNIVYASACSGIYKSDDGGAKFIGGVSVNKNQGIPGTARRTRVLMQDPTHLETIFAGTTEGLYRTDDGGKKWMAATGSDVIVNDVYVDPSNPRHVLLATDRGGVLVSDDGGVGFLPSNEGFSARQVTAYAADARRPSTLYVGMVNDKEWGGVFVSTSGGLKWSPMSGGLEGRDVFSLGQAPDGTMLAGTSHGIYLLRDGQWMRAGGDVPAATRARKAAAVPKAVPGAKTKPVAAAKGFDGTVYSFARSGDTLFAATSQGMLRSVSGGMIWKRVAAESLPMDEWRFLAVSKAGLVTASLNALALSADGGNAWEAVKLPDGVTQVSAVSIDGTGMIWVGDRSGLYSSADKGASWQTLSSLTVRNVDDLYFDEAGERLLVTSTGPATEAYAISIPTMTVKKWDTGWNLRFVRPVGDHLVAGTLFDGIVVQGRMVESPFSDSSTAKR